ncbi:MAG: 30S ribosomal protein S9 [Fimbriiglobus sp.]
MAEKKEAKTFYLGTGRRKTAVARVRITDGTGKIEINGRTLDDFFTEPKDRGAVTGPLTITDMATRLNISVKVHGGGITGQAGAISQGVARAIKTMFSPPSDRRSVTMNHVTVIKSFKTQERARAAAAANPGPTSAAATDGTATAEDSAIGMIKKLRDSGFLTRDSRMKERKKYGLRGARRGTQFSKR